LPSKEEGIMSREKNRKCKWGYHRKWNGDIWPTY
jgi:hypothetical protein